MDIAAAIKEFCLPHAQEDESKAFFYKMIGDYYRYTAENSPADKLEEVKAGANEGYQQADMFCKNIGACNPIKIGLALNYSVFHYDVMDNRKKAIELGELALMEALEKIDDADEETFRDAKSIIELLKENISNWKEEENDNALEDL